MDRFSTDPNQNQAGPIWPVTGPVPGGLVNPAAASLHAGRSSPPLGPPLTRRSPALCSRDVRGGRGFSNVTLSHWRVGPKSVGAYGLKSGLRSGSTGPLILSGSNEPEFTRNILSWDEINIHAFVTKYRFIWVRSVPTHYNPHTKHINTAECLVVKLKMESELYKKLMYLLWFFCPFWLDV